MKTLLVTGGAGFISANFVLRRLQPNPGLRIVILDALTYAGNFDTLASLESEARHIFVQGDICEGDTVARDQRPGRARPPSLLRDYRNSERSKLDWRLSRNREGSLSRPRIDNRTAWNG